MVMEKPIKKDEAEDEEITALFSEVSEKMKKLEYL